MDDLTAILGTSWWVFLLASIGGFLTGRILESPRTKLIMGLGITFAPPAAFSLLYWQASQSGCAGGSCIGAMFILLPIGLLALLLAAFGVGLLLEALRSLLLRVSLR